MASDINGLLRRHLGIVEPVAIVGHDIGMMVAYAFASEFRRSLTPFRYGDYIAKFSVAPVTSALMALTGREIDASDRPDAIRETVQSEMRGIEGVWEFRVQLCRNLERQPVEDPTVEWDEEEAPFQRVGTIVAQPQDSWDPARVQAVDEEMRFSVWTGLAAHQPLGNINRARNAPYRHSAEFRQRFNKCPIHEPGAIR